MKLKMKLWNPIYYNKVYKGGRYCIEIAGKQEQFCFQNVR